MKTLTLVLLFAGIVGVTPEAEAAPPRVAFAAPPAPPAPPQPPMPAGAPRAMRNQRRAGRDPLRDKLFPPELIMGHQEDIGLTDAQRKAIIKEIEGGQSKLVPLQWQVRAEADKLEAALAAPRVDEQRALALADKVSGLERDLKRLHLTLLIRIKNILSADQQQRLQQMRGGRGRDVTADW